jgi:hypothetical protein
MSYKLWKRGGILDIVKINQAVAEILWRHLVIEERTLFNLPPKSRFADVEI